MRCNYYSEKSDGMQYDSEEANVISSIERMNVRATVSQQISQSTSKGDIIAMHNEITVFDVLFCNLTYDVDSYFLLFDARQVLLLSLPRLGSSRDAIQFKTDVEMRSR